MNIKNIILSIIGFLSLTLGTIGIFLPVLPTTPFVLLSVGCFSISSPKVANLIGKNKYFGSLVDNYKNHTGIPRKTKIRAICFLWVGLILSSVLIKNGLIIALLMFIGLCVTEHLISIKNKD